MQSVPRPTLALTAYFVIQKAIRRMIDYSFCRLPTSRTAAKEFGAATPIGFDY
jgi:hypothetical protein